MSNWVQSEDIKMFNEIIKVKCKFCTAPVSHLGVDIDEVEDELSSKVSIVFVHFLCGTIINFHPNQNKIEEADIERDNECYEAEIDFLKEQLEIAK